MQMTTCSFSSWAIDSKWEPNIRVGVVLPEDEMRRVRFNLPDRSYRLSLAGKPAGTLRGVKAEISIEGEQVLLKTEQEQFGPADVIALFPEAAERFEQGAGLKARDVITGRGFHWQKRMKPALTGGIEVRMCRGFLLMVNELPMEQYLAGVITAEMSGQCPLEFLKSQCIVARSWVLAHTENKHPGLPIDRCNDDCCQRYHGTNDLSDTALQAVRQTRGQALVDRHYRIIDTNYSKSCGGIMESPRNVWSVEKRGLRSAVDAPAGSVAKRFKPVTDEKLDEYLIGDWLTDTDVFCSTKVVPDADIPKYLGKVDEGGGYFRWQIVYDHEEIEKLLKNKYFAHQDPARIAPLFRLTDLKVLRRGESGRAIDLQIKYLDAMEAEHATTVKTEYEIRRILHDKFLYSSAFKIEISRDDAGLPKRITFTGAGWGHGAGLCQIGALGMALKGYNCQAIMEHYFEGAEIHSCY